MTADHPQDLHALLEAAISARKRALALYSGFLVGAALEDVQGRIWTGCNLESSSYGLSICAERVALFKALSEGSRSFTRIVIVASGENLTPPCGACRQLLHDYAPTIEVILYDLGKDNLARMPLEELYPRPFGSGHLKKGSTG